MTPAPDTAALAVEVGRMIETARQQVAQATNAALTTLYWQIGTRIRQDVLKERLAEYGGEIVAAWCSSPRRSPTRRLSYR